MNEDLRELIVADMGVDDDVYDCPLCLEYVSKERKCSCSSWSPEELAEFIKPVDESTKNTCINYGENCIGCRSYFGYCYDERGCKGYCNACDDYGCENHPSRWEGTIFDSEGVCAPNLLPA
ncbi:MAG: hypothetical protein FWB87_13635 [Defluviitaleaceae bacterium]|nr:hypothetical protein [Defluviitaleaceae bacterium]